MLTGAHPTAGRIGYIYAACVVVGSVGAISLIVHSVSGAAAGVGFIVLLTLWICSLVASIHLAQEGRVTAHRRWAHRNYALTFAAVPFRFMPTLFSAVGADAHTAYALGAWFSTVAVIVMAEVYLRVDSTRATGEDGKLTEVSVGELTITPTPLP